MIMVKSIKYIPRYIEAPVAEDLKQKMVFVAGPRQSGKTTMARHLCEVAGFDIKQEESKNKDTWIDLILHKSFEMEQVLNIVQEGMLLRDRFKAV